MQAFFQEYGLLIAVATPVLVVVGMQVFLFIAGERGTLLLPSLKPFESIALAEEDTAEPIAEPAPQPVVVPATAGRTKRQPVRNDELEAA